MEHPHLHYKPGLTLDEPVTVTMAAADWLAFMVWAGGSNIDTSAVDHFLFAVIAPQIREKMYTSESLKATQAFVAQQRQASSPFEFLANLQGATTDPANIDWEEKGEDDE